MRSPVPPARRALAGDVCEHCGSRVDRVWLVPGDVLDSCAPCFEQAAGRPPVHEQGHTTRPASRGTSAASFYLRADGRRPA